MSAAKTLVALLGALFLAGCASTGIDEATRDVNARMPELTGGALALKRTASDQAAAAKRADELLARPLDREAAVQLALINSPTVQAMLAQAESDMAAAAQAGRIANPVLSFERMRLGSELEIGRLLSVGLLDIVMLPQRQEVARGQLAQARVQLAAAVVDQVAQVRGAWVRAVAASQSLDYAQQVNKAAQAGAELARRMQQVGNFSRLQRARQHVFYADAAAQLASASHAATAAREALIRQLGLTDAQAARLQLPGRLPELPAQPLPAPQVNADALQQRLDLQMARLQLDAAGKAQRLGFMPGLVDVQAGVRHDTVFDNATGQRASRNGFELDIRLPLFDWGSQQRGAMNARTLAAASRYDAVARNASSQLRESYSAWRTAHDLARHYRDEVVPLRKVVADENLLRYNGMLIGVFELLAETREQIAGVIAAIHAQEQFWLADAALSSALMGKPLAMEQQ